MRWYKTWRCSASDGRNASWLINRVCSSNQSCQQVAHVWASTIWPHLPGSGACASADRLWPQRRHATRGAVTLT